LAKKRQTHYSISGMLATAQNLNLARAIARLDALTDRERRPRGAMRVGLEPMLDLAARLGCPQKAFPSIQVANMS
jgi:dihydrofolate synthase / folylpolyglutamate synthase